jgi:hypothetical protein
MICADCGKSLAPRNRSGFCRAHRKADRDYRRRYYLAHREQELESAKAWAEANPDKRRMNNRLARRRARRADPEKANAECRASRLRHLEKRRAEERARKAREADAKALAAAAAAKASLKPNAAAQRLNSIAKAKAEEAKYGIERVAYA